MWSDSYAPLDLEARPDGYRLWKSKARPYLMGRHPQVGRVLDWAERQVEPAGQPHLGEAALLIPGFDIHQVNGMLFTAVQRTVSDQLRMTKPDLAGDGMGLELWRLLVREHEAPELPVVQREFQKRWAYPRRCKGSGGAPVPAPAMVGLGP